jgi:hypothetical protein
MKGYRLVCLNPQAPPTVANIQEVKPHCCPPDRRNTDAGRGRGGCRKKECERAHQLTVVVGAGAVGMAVPGGPGWHPSAKVPVVGVAGVEVLRVHAGVELSLVAAADGEEGQERERRSGGGEGGAHRCFSISLSFPSTGRHSEKRGLGRQQ